MIDQSTQLLDIMHRLERLLVRFEIDMAARLHVVDYQAIEILCDEFHAQMTELMSASAESTQPSASVSLAVSRGVATGHE